MPKLTPVVNKTKKNVQIKKFVKNYVENGGNGTQAMLATRPMNAVSAARAASRWLQRGEVRQAIAEALEKQNIDPDWIMSKRKQIINKGLEQLESGYVPYIKDEAGNTVAQTVQVTPGDVHKHLDGIESLMMAVGGIDKSDNSSNKHLHLHLNAENVGEIIAQRNQSKSFFDEILGEKTEAP